MIAIIKPIIYILNALIMKTQTTFLILLVLFSVSTVNGQDPDELRIRAILDRQQDCWNQGDVECFMEGYWESEDLKFIGSSGVTYGYDQTLENYRKRYPDRQAMGTLKFDILEMERICEDAFSVVGKFHLDREIGDLEGFFTLLWRKMEGEWVIVQDHSS
jgi:hypothetical protein